MGGGGVRGVGGKGKGEMDFLGGFFFFFVLSYFFFSFSFFFVFLSPLS